MEQQEPKKLKRAIGLWSAVAINVGAIIGGGIFVVTGIVAGYAHSALIISMVIAGIIAFLTATSFAKLTAWQPVEGSVYEYGRQLVSPYAGFLAGWMWIVANTFTGAAVSLGFAGYLTSALPNLQATIPIVGGIAISTASVIAAVLCVCFTALNIIGAKESAKVNNVLVVTKLVILAFFVVFGVLYVKSGNFLPFEPLTSGVLFGSFFIFFAYGGFARIAVLAEEVKDAKRNVPRAMLLSLGISMAVYVLVGLVAVGLLGSGGLSTSASPLTSAIGVSGNMAAMQVVSFGGLVATASVLLTAILGVSRMAFSMARGSDFPKKLSQLHSRFLTPYWAIIATGAVMSLLVLFIDLTAVVAVSTFALLFNYSITNISAYKLKTDSSLRRFLPLLALATCILLLVFILFASPIAWLAGILFMAAGSVYYWLQNRRRKFRKQVGVGDKNFKVQ